MDNTPFTHELRLDFIGGAVTEEKYLDLSRLLEHSPAVPFELTLEQETEAIPSNSTSLMRRFTGNQTIIIRTLPENADALDQVVWRWLSEVKAGERIVEGSMIYFRDGKAYNI